MMLAGFRLIQCPIFFLTSTKNKFIVKKRGCIFRKIYPIKSHLGVSLKSLIGAITLLTLKYMSYIESACQAALHVLLWYSWQFISPWYILKLHTHTEWHSLSYLACLFFIKMYDMNARCVWHLIWVAPINKLTLCNLNLTLNLPYLTVAWWQWATLSIPPRGQWQ